MEGGEVGTGAGACPGAERITLRKAVKEDIERIWRVHTDSVREICRDHYTPDQITSWAGYLHPDAYTMALRYKVLIVAVAEDDGRLLGFGQLNPDAASVERLYVSPQAAGKGIGSALLRSLEEDALSRGLHELHLYSTVNAADFYEGAGWAIVERARCHFPHGLILECIKMKKTLG